MKLLKFRKKPVVIEAMRLHEPNTPDDIVDWIGDKGKVCGRLAVGGNISNKVWIEIDTLEGKMIALYGDWIIKGVEGEFYLRKPSIFKKTYEQIRGLKCIGAMSDCGIEDDSLVRIVFWFDN